MTLTRNLIYIIAILLLQGFNAYAQDPVLRHFTVEDGLPGGNIYYCMQDSRGYIWSATDRGLVRFDGNEFKIFTIKDGLPSNDVWQIEEDSRGRLWLSTFKEICYIENGVVKILDLGLSSKDKGKVDHHFSVLGHFIWLTRSNRLVKIDEELNMIFRSESAGKYLFWGGFYLREDETDAFLFEDLKTQLGIPTSDTLLALDNTILRKNNTGIYQFLYTNRSIAYMSLSPKEVLFAQSDGIVSISDKGIREIDLRHLGINKGKHTINRLLQVEPNKIWIKTDEDELIVDTLFQLVPGFSFLKNYPVNSLKFDKQGNLWIGTSYGLYFLNKKGLGSKTFLINNGAKTERLQFLTTNKDKEIWGLSTEGSLYRLDDQKGLVPVYDRSLVQVPRDITFDVNGDLWVGGKEFFKISAEDIGNYPVRRNYVSADKGRVNVKSIKRIEARNDRLLVSNFAYLASVNLNKKDDCNSITIGRFYGLAELEDGRIWLSGKAGLKLVSKVGEAIGFKEKISNPVINYPIDNIVLDKANKLWFAVNNRGVYRLDQEKIDSIPELNEMLVQSLYLDAKDRLWVCTNQGLAKISIKESDTFKYTFQWITVIDGLASNDAKEVLVENDQIYIATEKGLTVLQDIDEQAENDYAPFHFSSLSINDRDTTVHDFYELNYTQNNIIIKFQSLDFKDMGSQAIQYKMEGVDKDWKETYSFQKEYPLLAPGDYTFKLRKKQIDPSNKSEELVMRIQINQPFWKRGSSLFMFALLLGGLTFLIYNRRIRAIEKRAEEENKLNQKFAELELTALQSQMNPHFIFNALHAIQDFIFKKDERIANRYLVKFSRLMRLFLESSKEKFILLEDEIQLLQLYIELEKLRFEDKFDFEINIADDLSPGMIEIPSMLLQPFVENAINHGLIHRTTPGKLALNFTKEKGRLHCRIEDNGIGRKRQLEIKNQSIKSYKSRGMQLVEERQRVWNRIGYATIDISVEDLYDADGVGVGTRIDLFVNLGD